jgi:signal transduction histidine kinase
VRVRLAVLYAAAFLAAGVVLVAATYWLVSRSLAQPIEHPQDLAESIGHPQDPSTHQPFPSDDPRLEAAHVAVEAYRSDVLGRLLTWSLLALAGALVLAVALGWVLAGRALRPLRQITKTANRVADRRLDERIALDGPDDEIKELADTIDAMLERLDRAFDAQRRFVANASHELRTPLAVNRTLLEVALGAPDVSDDLQQLGPELLANHGRTERLIEGLLTQARSQHDITQRTPLNLAELAAVAVAHEQPEAQQRGITLSTDLQPAPVRGNRVLMERLAANLVQNAVRHSPAGTEAIVRTGQTDDSSVLQVENPGPVLQQQEIDAWFEPFQRGDGRVSDERGVGLGLSIVQSVAQTHGGRALAHPREGGGPIIRVELPTHPT